MNETANRRTIDGWRDLAANKLELNDDDMCLVEALAKNIMGRWETRAAKGPAGHEKAMEVIYQHERDKAIVSIVAAVELIQSIGKGGRLPDEYADLIKVKA
jgi:hypothetical protein